MENQTIHIDPHLCIDLDGTLVKLDTLHQAICLLVRRNQSPCFPSSMDPTRQIFKKRSRKAHRLHVEHLPYNTALLDYLRVKKKPAVESFS